MVVHYSRVNSSQFTCRLSLKMDRAMNKNLWCTVLISDIQKYHLSQTMVSSNQCVGRLRIPWIDSKHTRSKPVLVITLITVVTVYTFMFRLSFEWEIELSPKRKIISTFLGQEPLLLSFMPSKGNHQTARYEITERVNAPFNRDCRTHMGDNSTWWCMYSRLLLAALLIYTLDSLHKSSH